MSQEGWSVGELEDPETSKTELSVMLDRYQRELADAATSVATYSCHALPAALIEPFREHQRYLENEIVKLESVLKSRGVGAPPVSKTEAEVKRVVERITSKQQIRLGLLKARDEMRASSPPEFHADIDRSFRMAIDELQE